MKSATRKYWWVALVLGFFAVNLIASYYHGRIDLTQDKRYSLSAPTKRLLHSLHEPVEVNVFLKGEFSADFRKLVTSVDEFMQECREESNGMLRYKFTNPVENLDDSSARYVLDSINYFYGIPPLTLAAPSKVGDEQTVKLVVPGAVIHYRDTTMGVNFFQGQRNFGTEPEQLAALYNNVEAALEYRIASTLQKATSEKRPSVAYLLGNGEGWGYNVDDAIKTMLHDFRFDTVNLQELPVIPQFDAVVMMKPTRPFSDDDKVKLDQYVMHGGKLFIMVDNMYTEFDSLYKSNGFIAFDRGLNLEDLLFNYGVRLDQTLVQDMQSDQLGQISNNGSNQTRLVNWPFFPILDGTNHPISKNLDGVRTMFPTQMDTVEAAGIKKTVLLQTTNNTRLLEAPAKIDFEFLQIAPDKKLFRHPSVPVAMLLEGKFRSLYSGRISKALRDSFALAEYPVLNEAEEPGKIIVVSDGDIAMNQYSPSTGPTPMGYNFYTRYTYGNKEFFNNCLDYLVNPSDILQTRSKEFALRLLDPRKTESERGKWQIINLVLPVLLAIIAGMIFQQVRKRRFARTA